MSDPSRREALIAKLKQVDRLVWEWVPGHTARADANEILREAIAVLTTESDVVRYDHAQAMFFRDGMLQHEKALGEAIRQLGGQLRVSEIAMNADPPSIHSLYDMATDETILAIAVLTLPHAPKEEEELIGKSVVCHDDGTFTRTVVTRGRIQIMPDPALPQAPHEDKDEKKSRMATDDEVRISGERMMQKHRRSLERLSNTRDNAPPRRRRNGSDLLCCLLLPKGLLPPLQDGPLSMFVGKVPALPGRTEDAMSGESREEFERDRMGETGEKNAATRKALLPVGQAPAPWQPIETCPENTRVLVVLQNSCIVEILLHESAIWTDGEYTFQRPRCWMPLPAVPVEAPAQEPEK